MRSLKYVLVSVIAIVIMGFTAGAQEESVKTKAVEVKKESTHTPGKYVDEDKDGVCDNHEKYHKDGYGANYVDANNDGVCDNYSSGKGYGKGMHHGHGYGHGYGHGHNHGHRHGSGYGYRHGYYSE